MGRTFYLFKVVWGMLAVGVLARAASRFDFAPNVDPEGNVALLAETLLLMLPLTFPLGLAAPLVPLGALLLIGFVSGSVFGTHAAPSLTVHHVLTFVLLLAMWGSLFAAGYYQWFVLLPRRVAKARELRDV